MSQQKHVYIVPHSHVQLQNNLFNKSGDVGQRTWAFVKDYCAERDILLDTVDYWKPGESEDSSLFVLTHPNEDLAHRLVYLFRVIRMKVFGTPYYKIKYFGFNRFLKQFSKKVLFHGEAEVVIPSVFRNLERLKRIYDKIYLMRQTDEFGYLLDPQLYDSPVEPYFSNKDRKFLVMMNNNKKPAVRGNELYSERLRAIKYFSKTGEFDLYGGRWDRHIYFPYTLYKKYVKKTHRGYSNNKLETVSRYKFAICFENEIAPGFVTEKMLDCLLVGTVPVYWGAPNITDFVPANCFIDFRKFKNYDALLEYLKKITPEEMEEYRNNMRAYYKSQMFQIFTKPYFARTVLDAINKYL